MIIFPSTNKNIVPKKVKKSALFSTILIATLGMTAAINGARNPATDRTAIYHGYL